MGLLTPNDIKNFRSLYTLQLRYLLSAENQIVEGLESMKKHARDEQLQQAFQSHGQESALHAERLQQLLGELDGKDDERKDLVLTALVGSAENIVKESEAGPVRDAGLLASAQKVEHYEIASYGAARDWAKLLELPQHAELLQKTIDEEKHANTLLGKIAERANPTAAAAA